MCCIRQLYFIRAKFEISVVAFFARTDNQLDWKNCQRNCTLKLKKYIKFRDTDVKVHHESSIFDLIVFSSVFQRWPRKWSLCMKLVDRAHLIVFENKLFFDCDLIDRSRFCTIKQGVKYFKPEAPTNKI